MGSSLGGLFNVTKKLGTILILAVALNACKFTPHSQQAYSLQAHGSWQWQAVKAIGQPTARHEASFLEHQGLFYLIGGRRINPVDVFDPKNNTWVAKSNTPLEIHHFQAVSHDDAIYIVGAMTGSYPNETPLANVIAYYPKKNEFKTLHEIPKERRRGGAGAVVYNGKIYIVGGIKNGHVDGYVPWLDVYDPVTGDWEALPDADFARDHVQAAVLDNKLYVFGGRTSRQRTGQTFELLVKHGEIYDFDQKEWLIPTQKQALPTLRAGHMMMAWGDEIIVVGGESHVQKSSHFEVDAFNTVSQVWRRWPNPINARHGTGLAIHNGYVYVASGSANSGGGPELSSIERLKLPVIETKASEMLGSGGVSLPIKQQWHTVELDFIGPEVSESGTPNPFLDYRLDVDFTHESGTQTVRGFFAADGNAANSGAESGRIWRVRFTPQKKGQWKYAASLSTASNIALADDVSKAQNVKIENDAGAFYVVDSDKELPDFRAKGVIEASGSYFKFRDTDQYWIKTGANSPENILGFHEFDNTYRYADNQREGEATVGIDLHTFEPHLSDWQLGDPTWRNGKGKALIGAYNYLADKGMNSSYFLTMNINGDGKDVWPYVSHKDVTRFDVSKLAQWNIVFDHMQAKGILLHVVIQETENELLLDNGDTGPQRKLYLNELIARFSHHPGLVWNLGEENGPTSWSPKAQNDEQRRAMSHYFNKTDPYNHPVLLHTHSTPEYKDEIVGPQLGVPWLDGLSFQVEKRPMVNNEIQHWRARSKKAGKEWLITMDEIGTWMHGALPDAKDPNHDRLRQWVLWGTLLGGGAGVEWYFGSKHEASDLTSENWRKRDRLWTITNHARAFFEKYVPYWRMQAANDLVKQQGDPKFDPAAHPEHGGLKHDNLYEDIKQKPAYAFAQEGEFYLAYFSRVDGALIDLSNASGQFELTWFDPINGGSLQTGSVGSVAAGEWVSLGSPPSKQIDDWVVMLRKTKEQ